jgi:hypothetical protein
MESIALRKSDFYEKRQAAVEGCCWTPVGFLPLNLLMNQFFCLKVQVAAVTRAGKGESGRRVGERQMQDEGG